MDAGKGLGVRRGVSHFPGGLTGGSGLYCAAASLREDGGS